MFDPFGPQWFHRSVPVMTDFGRLPAGVRLDLVLPCLDEAGALPGVLAALPAGFRAIVVDNGSRDGSAEIARSLGAFVVHEPRRGYGAAVHAGLLAADAEYVAMMDCDGSMAAGDIVQLLAHLVDGRADLVCGRRRPVASGVWPWHARWGNQLLARLISLGARHRLRDIAPVRVARRADLLALQLTDRRCGYPLETLLRTAEGGWRISEFDIAYHPRAVGTRSKITGTARGTAIAVRDFAAVLVDHRRHPRPVVPPGRRPQHTEDRRPTQHEQPSSVSG
jgi:molybdopterin-guanine dinucleotide biosynthesis protein A